MANDILGGIKGVGQAILAPESLSAGLEAYLKARSARRKRGREEALLGIEERKLAREERLETAKQEAAAARLAEELGFKRRKEALELKEFGLKEARERRLAEEPERIRAEREFTPFQKFTIKANTQKAIYDILSGKTSEFRDTATGFTFPARELKTESDIRSYAAQIKADLADPALERAIDIRLDWLKRTKGAKRDVSEAIAKSALLDYNKWLREQTARPKIQEYSDEQLKDAISEMMKGLE